MSLVHHHITVVEKLCKRGHYSPLRWTGLAAEGELNWLFGLSGFFGINGGVKPLDYFIQMLKKNHLQVFLTSIFVTTFLRNSYPVNCALSSIYVFSASFYSVKLLQWSPSQWSYPNLPLIDIQEMLPWQFCNFTCEIMN